MYKHVLHLKQIGNVYTEGTPSQTKEQKSIYTLQLDLTSMVVVKIEKPGLNGSSQYIHQSNLQLQ